MAVTNEVWRISDSPVASSVRRTCTTHGFRPVHRRVVMRCGLANSRITRLNERTSLTVRHSSRREADSELQTKCVPPNRRHIRQNGWRAFVRLRFGRQPNGSMASVSFRTKVTARRLPYGDRCFVLSSLNRDDDRI